MITFSHLKTFIHLRAFKLSQSSILTIFSFVLLSSCASVKTPKVPSPIQTKAQVAQQTAESTALENNTPQTKKNKTSFYGTPKPQKLRKASKVSMSEDGPKFKAGKLELSAENLSIPAFINEVFANLLGANFILDPSLQNRKDRVTLRVPEPQTPEQLYLLAQQVLFTYGIDVVPEDNLFRITLANKKASKLPPLLVSGNALPDVPLSHRPIFQLVPLKVVRNALIMGWLNQTYKGTQLTLQMDQQRNAIILIGPEHIVKEAVRSIDFFDQPYLRGRHSIRIEPAFISATDMATQLVNVLIAQGYAAGQTVAQSGSILVLPVQKANMVLLFASDREVLNHARQWALTLDKTNQHAGDQSLFYYQVQNTRADSISTTLNSLISGTSLSNTGNTVNTGAGTTNNTNSRGNASGNAAGGLIVDEARNSLLFKGEPSQWERLLPMIRQMDKPAKQVLIEMTIAEVSLSDKEVFGIEWFANGSNGRFDSAFTSTNGSGVGGFDWVVNVGGNTKATLNAFAEDSRVNILSTPRILVKTGEEASLDVVTEIPTVTGRLNANSQSGGGTDIIEEITYRKTGIVLTVEPVIHAGNRIDLDISQEVSETLPTDKGGTASSPAIFNRNVSTSLSLQSGNSVFLAGLISTRDNNDESGVPVLKDIPWLGKLFKSSSISTSRTELVITIVPYIISDENDAKDITDALMSSLELIDTE